MKTKKRVLQRWTKSEIELLKGFFSETRTEREKKEFSIMLGRTWPAIYNKKYCLDNPHIKENYRKRLKKTKQVIKKEIVKENNNIVVTHVNSVVNKINIGNVIIETMSSKIMIDGVLIEVM